MTVSFHQNQTLSYQEEDVPCIEFSAMGFSCHGSQQSFTTASSSVSSATSRSSNLSGWGSAVSRKSYACLKTLGEMEARKLQRPPKQVARKVAVQDTSDSWGYFVDTPGS
mmetsp:Transcript_11526/g.21545  ORF Transcript_11526/g.21545 Transcript_11526/m.21545 type:complete len:110 (-) Transcript_11526:436-765(-)|eukprot:CAMPEP_0176481888 /NCGR_PEP_ID=MMETSP0200_2-20121128/3076_1 /TAXON_ID=947934 /ORGANISM="Chaetoceros sp., Strain GSL56" /LENGTH=109 /DNA_ID=CAMNT_0017878155 /DNA_START=57 /DNA_END=386 /DNA_ORIENTATION=-